MNQLSLFADLLPASTPVPVVLTGADDSSVAHPGHPVQPRIDRPAPIESVPSTSAVKASEPDTLLKLAALIREGRDQLEAQSRRRSRPVQSIGELAQSVLRRHDLVASRRAASQQVANPQVVSRSENKAGFADKTTEVHVAS